MADISPPQRDIPDKLYFRIGEVTAITDLAAYVLRFWESEFPDIKPKRTESGQRLYRKSDIETLLLIKHLLYDKKFTIQAPGSTCATATARAKNRRPMKKYGKFRPNSGKSKAF